MVRRRTWVVLCLLAVTGVILAGASVFGWAQYHVLRGRAAAERQQFAVAHTHFTEALSIWRRSASTHLEAARAARRAGMLQEAERHLESCQRLQGNVSDELRLERLLIRAVDGEIMDVQEGLWRSVEEDHPEKIVILESLVLGYMKVSSSSAGRAAIARLLELQPDNIVGLYWRGIVREQTEDDEEAIADYRQVLEILPDHADARKHLADLLVKTDAREALEHITRLRQKQPRDFALLVSQANCWKALGNPEEAAMALDELLADNPDHVGALIQRGLLAVQDGQAAQGEKWLRKAITIQPSSEDAQYHLYQCLLQQPGREAEAQQQFVEWKRVQADLARLNEIATKQMDRAMRDPALIHEVGLILLRSNQDDMALRWFQMALELQANFEPVHRTLAEYYRSKGKDDLAEQHRKKLPNDGK
jgi:tetratricopeptide (TPR) repeat protein